MIFHVRVIANAKEDAIVEQSENYLKIRISAPPSDDKANKKLIEFLANHFGVRKSSVLLLKGYHHKDKVIEVIQ